MQNVILLPLSMKLLGKELIDQGSDIESKDLHRRYTETYSILGITFQVRCNEYLIGKTEFIIKFGEITRAVSVYTKALEDPVFSGYIDSLVLEVVFSKNVAAMIILEIGA